MLSKHYAFSSERLSYRGIAEADAKLIVSWRSEPDNARNFFGTPPTLESHLEWFRRYLADASRYDFMIFDPDGARIGTVSLSGINGESCEVGYMIGDKSARGRGYATEAVRAATQLAFDELGIRCVDARIKVGNTASERVAAGGGFREYEHVWRLEAPGALSDEQREHGGHLSMD